MKDAGASASGALDDETPLSLRETVEAFMMAFVPKPLIVAEEDVPGADGLDPIQISRARLCIGCMRAFYVGALPEWFVARVEAATELELMLAIVRVPTGESLGHILPEVRASGGPRDHALRAICGLES